MADPFDDRPRDGLDKLLRKLPGFSGYVERAARAASDRLARQHVAEALQRAKTSLESVTRQLVDDGAIESLPKYDRFRGKVDHQIAKLLGAPAGYQGFLDIDTELDDALDDIYEHDLWMIDTAEQFAAATQEIIDSSPSSDADGMLQKIASQFQAVENKIKEREKMLADYGH